MSKGDIRDRAGLRSLLRGLCLLGIGLGSITIGFSSVTWDPERSWRTFWAGVVMVGFSFGCFVLATRQDRSSEFAESLVLVVEGRHRAWVFRLGVVMAVVCALVGLLVWLLSGSLSGAWLLWHPAWIALLVGLLVERERSATKNRALLLLAMYADGKCDAMTRDAIDGARASNERFDAIVRQHVSILERCRTHLLASGDMAPRI